MLLVYAEEYIARFEPEITAEELFVEMQDLLEYRKEFEDYLIEQPSKLKAIKEMPKKSDQILEHRKLFIHWYIDRNKGRYQQEVVQELTKLVFASETTIYSILYNYR